MATGTVSSRPPKDSAPTQGRYDDFIQQRLEQTRRQVRLVDFGSGIVLLLAASFLFFLLVALADHWLFAHGLNFFARLLLFGVWMAGTGWFIWRAVAPSVMHRINPVFAAQAIEHGRPTLKNSLINFLLLRSHPENVAPVVYQAMEHRAASDLSRVPIEQAVDHRRFIHLCYALAAAVVLFALYVALSPKNPLVSAARVMWPLASLPAPTRVHIEHIQPGDKIVYQGDRQKISARVAGLRDGEQVSLLMSTADGQIVDDRVTMNRTGEDNSYACELPPGSGGLLQSTTYRINAGDATTQPFKLDVEIAPTINIDQVDYHFPAYTGMRDRSIRGQGDIKALEGTRVTIHATANVDIKEAGIAFGSGEGRLMPMSHNGKLATGEFTLAGEQEQGKAWKPFCDRYQLVLTDIEGHKARRPIEYRIDVDRDYPPEVSVVEPKPDTVDVAVSGHLLIRLHASDDFGLRRVAIRAVRNGETLNTPVLFDRLPPDKPLTKPVDFDYDLRPADLHLIKGDEVNYWVEAEDNKEPKHNHAETARRTIRIVDEQEAQRGQSNKLKQEEAQNQPGDGQTQQGKKDGQGKSDDGSGNSSDKSQDGSNGASSSEKKDGQKGDPSKSKNPEKSDKSDPSKSEKGNAVKDRSSPESTEGSKGEPDSSDHGGQGNKRTDPGQKAVAMKDIVKDMEKEQKNQQKDQSAGKNSQPGQEQDQNQQGDNKDGSPQKGAQPENPQQSGQDKKSPQGGQGTQQPQGAPGEKSQLSGASGSPQPKGNNPSESASNNNPQGQEPKPGAQDSGNPGNEKTSPQQSDNTQQPSGGSPQGSPKAGDQAKTGQSSPQSAGSQGKEQAKSSAGPKKDGAGSGAGNKPDVKPAGGGEGKEQSASGGSPSSKEKPAGGEKSGGQSGGSQSKANPEKKSPSSGGSENSNELAMKSGEPQKKNPSQSGSDVKNEMPGGSRQKNTTKPKTNNGDGGGGSQKSEQKPEKKQEDGGGGSGGEKQPQPGGEKPEPGSGKPSPSGTPNGKPGNMTDGDPGQKNPGKTGDPGQRDSTGAPDPQVDPQRGGDKTGQAKQGLDQSDKSQSPGNSPHDSDSKGNTNGANSGGGGAGGGQKDNKAGKGSPGSTTDAPSGGSASDQKGGDAPGKKAGEKLETTDNTASPRNEAGNDSGEKPEPSDKQATNESPNKPDNTAQNSSNTPQNAGDGQSGAPSSQQAGQQGSGFPAGGSQTGNLPPAPPSKSSSQAKADEADQKFAKSQVDMALRHLKDEASKPKSELLDRLGWTPEEAKKFAENIEKLRDSAKQPSSEGEKNYSEFLKDLGLRPHGTRIEASKTKADDLRGVRDAPQMEPPADWSDITRGYSQTTAAGQK